MSQSIHKSHTFAFVDLADFTALTEAHADIEAVELLDRFVALTTTSLGVEDRIVKAIDPDPEVGTRLGGFQRPGPFTEGPAGLCRSSV